MVSVARDGGGLHCSRQHAKVFAVTALRVPTCSMYSLPYWVDVIDSLFT